MILRGEDLCAAAGDDELAEIERLLDGGSEMTEHPALTRLNQLIAFSDDLEAMAALVTEMKSAGVDIDTRSEIFDNTLLGRAADYGKMPVVQLLLDAGADPNTRFFSNEQYTALAVAALGGYLETVESLLDAGADPAFVDPDGRTIVERMVDPFERENYSLEWTNDHERIVQLLQSRTGKNVQAALPQNDEDTHTDSTLGKNAQAALPQIDEDTHTDSAAAESPHPLFSELVEIGSVPNNSDGVADGLFFWRPLGEGVGPDRLWDQRTREIGEALYKEASCSIQLMLQAHGYVVTNLGDVAGQALSAHWHKIGEPEWQDGNGECWMH